VILSWGYLSRFAVEQSKETQGIWVFWSETKVQTNWMVNVIEKEIRRMNILRINKYRKIVNSWKSLNNSQIKDLFTH